MCQLDISLLFIIWELRQKYKNTRIQKIKYENEFVKWKKYSDWLASDSTVLPALVPHHTRGGRSHSAWIPEENHASEIKMSNKSIGKDDDDDSMKPSVRLGRKISIRALTSCWFSQVFRIARIMRVFKLARSSVGLKSIAHTVSFWFAWILSVLMIVVMNDD